MNQLKYRLTTDIKSELSSLKKTLRQQAQEDPKQGQGYAMPVMTWDKLKSQCKPLHFTRK